MDALEQLSEGRLVSLSALEMTSADIMLMHSRPWRACPCCDGEAYHTQVIQLGFMILTRRIKCRDCDEHGLAAYFAFN